MPRSRFFVPGAAGIGPIALPDSEAHHARHVLRLREGAELSVFDGRGREWIARVSDAGKRGGVIVNLVAETAPAAEPPVRVTVGIAVLKGDQMDAVVRDATMLGVAAVAPLVSARVTVPARAWKGPAARDRWQRVAIASAKQCGRAVVPAIRDATPFETCLREERAETRLICTEPAAAPGASLALTARPASALVLIGPEGGWTDDELDAARRAGAASVRCGPRTLRAETAPTVVLASLWTVWGW